ncbi:unnamed protein product [Caenorhabditis nigoni]
MTPTGSKESKNPHTPSKSEEFYFPKKGNWKKWIPYAILIFIILALVVALVVVLALGNVNFGKGEVCETPGCFTIANSLHNWKDDSVDPCKDFFKYSCGKYSDHSTIDEAQLGGKTEIGHALIREFLRKNETSSSKTENAMIHLNKKCQEIKMGPYRAIDKVFPQEMRSEVEQLGWPMLDPNWKNSNFDLSKLLRQIGTVNSLKRFTINYGIFNLMIPGARKLIFQSNTQFITDPAEVQEFLNIIFPPSNRPYHLNITFEAECIVWFGTSFQKIIQWTPLSNDLDFENNYGKLKSAFPGLDFDSLIRDQLSNQAMGWNKVQNKIYGYKDFAEKAAPINNLVNMNHRITANYLIYQYILNMYAMTPLLETLRCEQIVAHYLPLPSLRVFVRNHFDKEVMKDVDNLVENIRSSFIEMLGKSEWAHEKLKNGAIRKAKNMKKMISYPAELEKPGALDKHFNIQLDPSDSFYSTLRKIDRASSNILVDFAASDFPMVPIFGFQSNAIYTRVDNAINVLPLIMDEPLFHTSFPNYAKIAGIGFIIGHEIGHGFDAEGITLDENGKEWHMLDANDKNEYEKRAMCLINQYNNYDDPSFGRKLNGTLVIMEMMADEIGQDVSWRTFKNLDFSKEKKIIGFEDLSFEQLYFRIEALKWCSPRSPLTLQQQLSIATHATNSFRVNGVFANEKAFAEAFNCPVGSPMNPVKKCTMF